MFTTGPLSPVHRGSSLQVGKALSLQISHLCRPAPVGVLGDETTPRILVGQLWACLLAVWTQFGHWMSLVFASEVVMFALYFSPDNMGAESVAGKPSDLIGGCLMVRSWCWLENLA